MEIGKEMVCPTFYPSQEEFQNFSAYIESISKDCFDIGICKIVPPNNGFNCKSQVWQQSISTPGKKGVYTVDLVEEKAMSLDQFKKIASEMDDRSLEEGCNYDEVEKKFWKSLRPTMTPPIYGADISGSMFHDNFDSSWNLNKLETILREVNLSGISSSMLYFGMWKSMFALHTEDMNLYSINYIHSGKPKSWYAIPRQHAGRLERLAQTLYPDIAMKCKEFLRHKTCLLSPSRLQSESIPYIKAVQEEGQFIITFPYTYHSGFNHGFNIAEAVNFANIDWIPFAKVAKVCLCRPGSVRIDMDEFIAHLHSKSGRLPACSSSDSKDNETWHVFNCSCGEYSCTKNLDAIQSVHSLKSDTFKCCDCYVHVHIKCTLRQLPHENDHVVPEGLVCVRCFQLRNLGKTDENMLGLEKESDYPTNRKRSLREKRIRKGQQVKIRGKHGNLFLATIVDKQDDYIRLHFKGSKTDCDEWHSIKSSSIVDICSEENPPVKRTKGSSKT